MNEKIEKNIQAAVFKRLLDHLRKNTELQNIDLMELAGFCRNCLSKWTVEEAKKLNIDLDYEDTREFIYGMPYSEWKNNYQKPLKKK